MKVWVLATALISWAGLELSAQVVEPRDAGAAVMGAVVSATDGRPLARVLITVSAEGSGPPLTTVTDIDGRFTLSLAQTMPAARRDLTALKAGFTVTTVSIIPAGQVLVRLFEGAALAGRVIDDLGEPVVDADVRVTHRDQSLVASATTDDRGEFHLAVPPGQEVFLSVTVGRTRIERALAIRLQPGELRSAVDFVVSAPVTLREDAGGTVSDTASGVILGRVLNGAERGVANALVVLSNERTGSGTRSTRTDGAGQFEFRQVPPGWFRVTTSKPGYASATARPAVNVRASRPVEVTLRVTSHASIAGRVLSEFGDPIEGARIQVLAMRYVRGRRVATFAGRTDVLTDQRGAYRIHGLEPGVYVVGAELVGEGATHVGYRPTYFGTAGPGDAALITVSRGQAVDDIDVRLSRWPVFRVAGRAVGSNGHPITGTAMLVPSGAMAKGIVRPASVRLEPDGGFEFRDVARGDYVVQAYGGSPGSGAEDLFGAQRVTVTDSDVTEMAVAMSAGSSISGVVTFDSVGVSLPSRTELALTAVPADIDLASGSWPTAGADADGRFSLIGVSGLRRLVPTRVPAGGRSRRFEWVARTWPIVRCRLGAMTSR